jgi:hypothetical protein
VIGRAVLALYLLSQLALVGYVAVYALGAGIWSLASSPAVVAVMALGAWRAVAQRRSVFTSSVSSGGASCPTVSSKSRINSGDPR